MKLALARSAKGASLCLLAAALPACVATPDAGVARKSGRQVAEQRCSGCHAIGLDDTGRDPNAPALRTVYRRYPIDALRSSFARGLKVGHRDMPQFSLQPAEIDSLLAYLRSLDPCGQSSSDIAALATCFEPMK